LTASRRGRQPPRGARAGPVTATARLTLRPPCADDADALLGFVGDPDTMRWIGDQPGGPEKAREVVARWMGRWERDGVGQFVVERDGEPLGRVGLIVWDTRTWELSSYDAAGAHAQEELGWALASRPGATATRPRPAALYSNGAASTAGSSGSCR
jgi:RimJ/RimL family protein N-acetyltransferase